MVLWKEGKLPHGANKSNLNLKCSVLTLVVPSGSSWRPSVSLGVIGRRSAGGSQTNFLCTRRTSSKTVLFVFQVTNSPVLKQSITSLTLERGMLKHVFSGGPSLFLSVLSWQQQSPLSVVRSHTLGYKHWLQQWGNPVVCYLSHPTLPSSAYLDIE